MFDFKLSIKNAVFQLLFLTILASLVHLIVLKFIFPGYYSPLYPHHSDFYLSAAFANSPGIPYKDLLSWPRPVNMMFLKLIGHLGILGSTAAIIALVCLNVSLGAFLLKHFLQLPFNNFFAVAFIGYCYLVFSQPFFYTFYSQDVGAQLSYFFLLLGVCFFYYTFNKSIILSASLLLICGVLGFLSKETYGLSALFFGFIWFIYYYKRSFLKACVPFIAISISLFIIILINIHIKSVFVNLNSPTGTPYKISFTPVIILQEWKLYLFEAINYVNCFMILLIAFLIYHYKKKQKNEFVYIIVGCISAMFLSLLPNAILPNHHISGYSFNGSYLFYLPLLFVPVLSIEKKRLRVVLVLIIICCATSPLFNKEKYKSNGWQLVQESIERNLLKSLELLIFNVKPSPKPVRIVVVGITFPFSPFDYPESLRCFEHAEYSNFDVVKVNPPFPNQRRDLVEFIQPSDTLIKKYDQKWVFDGDGKIIELTILPY